MSKGTSKTMTVIKMLPLLQYVFPEIKNAFYHIDQDTKEEYVSVRYVNIVYAESLNRFIEDRASNAALKINVTADSPSALVDDVWRECKRRFGFQEVKDVIILETHNGGDRLEVSKDDYVLAESVDVIQLLPVDDELEIRTFYKPFWKVVKQ